MNSLLYDKILNLTKFRAFAKDKFSVAQIMSSVSDMEENMVGKGENAGYRHFLLFPLCFQKLYFSDLLKFGMVWYRVKSCDVGVHYICLFKEILMSTHGIGFGRELADSKCHPSLYVELWSGFKSPAWPISVWRIDNSLCQRIEYHFSWLPLQHKPSKLPDGRYRGEIEVRLTFHVKSRENDSSPGSFKESRSGSIKSLVTAVGMSGSFIPSFIA